MAQRCQKRAFPKRGICQKKEDSIERKNMFYPDDNNFSKTEERAYARERLIYNVTEDILIALEDAGVSKKELARRLSKSRSYVTQILSGARNMTLGSLSDICFALEIKPEVSLIDHAGQVMLDALGEAFWANDDVTPMGDAVNPLTETVIDCSAVPQWENAKAA